MMTTKLIESETSNKGMIWTWLSYLIQPKGKDLKKD